MKKLLTLLLLVICAGLISTQKVQASHAQGADLTYAYTGTANQYLLTLRFYRDCAGIPAPGSVDICYSSISLGFNQTITLFPIGGTGNPIPQSPCVNTTINCAGGLGTEEWIYQGTVVLPGPAIDWIFGFQVNARNAAITTLVTPSNFGLYVATYLNSVAFPTNSSPVFDSVPVTTFCVNNQFYYFQGANDPDGDSLHYSLVSAEDANIGGCPFTPITLQYVSPYSALNPLSTTSGTTIDPNTGVISFIPNSVQVGVLCVLVEEFDTTQVPAVKKGSVKRDLQVIIINNCIVIQPAPTNLAQQVVVGPDTIDNVIFANCGDTSVIVRLSDIVQCGSIASDGSDFRAIRPNGQPNPIFHAEPVNCTNGRTDSVLVFLYYPLTQKITKLYIKKGTDGNTMLSECGNSIYETSGNDTISVNDTINILVLDNSTIELNFPIQVPCVFNQFTIHFLDQMLCSTIKPNGSDFLLKDATGAVFPIASAYGACVGSPSSLTQDITVVMQNTVAGVSPFYLISMVGSDNNTLANFCERYINAGDTIAIIDASAPLFIDLGPDINQCISDPKPVLNSQITGATYTWTLNGTLLADTTQFITAIDTGTYIVNVVVSPSCMGSDTIHVSFILAPNAEIFANGVSTNSITLCQGTPYPNLDGTAAGATSYNWLLNGTSVSSSATYTPIQDGQYILQVSSGGSCFNSDTITINTIAQVIVSLGNDTTLCSNQAPPVLDAGGFPSATYLWNTGATTQTLIPPSTIGAVTYTVTVTYGGICSASGSVQVNINQGPVSPALQDLSICSAAGTVTLDGNPSGIQPPGAIYTWTDASGNVVGNNAVFQTGTAGTYVVTINNNGCVVTDTVVVNVEQPLAVTLGNDATICQSGITLDAGFPGQVQTYSWTMNGTPFSGNSQTVTVTGAGVYQVITTTPGGCTASSSVTITAGTFPTTISGNNPICETSAATLDGGYPGPLSATYAWTLNGSPTGPNANQITTNQSGNYAVTITNQYGCIAMDTAMLFVEKILPAPVPSCASASTGNFKYVYTWAAVAGATAYEVSVDGGVTWITPNTPSGPTSHGVQTPAKDFRVRAIGTLCGAGKNSEPAPCEIIIPNFVTPNNDNFNDVFSIRNLEQYNNVHVKIYNRWGNVIFEDGDYGSTNNYGFKDQPDGTYFYVLNVPEQEGRSGFITVVRDKK